MENRSELRSYLIRMASAIGSPHMIGGTPAGIENQDLVTQFYTAWLHLASDVLSQSSLSIQSEHARMTNFVSGLIQTDVKDVLTICQDAADTLIGNCHLTYGDFKGHLTQMHPGQSEVISRLLSPVTPLLEALFECPDVKAVSLQSILSFLRYGKKLNLKAIGIEEQALTAYLETEDRLSALALDLDSDLIQGLNHIMRCWLRDLDLTNLVPQHGNGSVAEGKLTLYEKYKALKVDIYLKIVLGPVWPEFYPFGSAGELSRVSRTIFVPKTFSKLRTISMEPATLQYFQQGIMKKLYSFIDGHPYLGWRIQLKDQTQNRNMAKEGSISDSMSTLDLSAASDSVAWSLVKAVFYRTPLLKWLYATRSKKTKLPDGKVIALKKFAPMGSALCFPIECLIFAAVIEYVTQKWCKTNKKAKPDYSVYGDDLIVARGITDEVIEALESLGFIVNRSKSFTKGPFRESCGGDYYEGIDVSSVYYRLPAYNVRRMSPEVYAAICSASNLCAERGLYKLRSYLVSLILDKGPYFTDNTNQSPALYSPQPTNYHVSRHWSKDYQCWLGKFCTVLSKPIQRELQDSDDVAYFVRLAQMAEQKTVRLFDEPVVDVTLHGSNIRLGYSAREVECIE